jgi:hypothetical protein
VLFTIHTYLATLAEVCVNPVWRRNLHGWLDTAPQAWIEYKGLHAFVDAVHGYLNALASKPKQVSAFTGQDK